jgi:RHS repeat-associated protein
LDYLGNVRETYGSSSSGAIQDLQENDYYPFGLTVKAYDNSNGNRYLYNKKEEQYDLTNQYDYGARFYAPVIARWTSIDPMAAKYSNFSPYVYCKDNPVSFFDFEGGDVTPAQYRDFFLNYAVSLYDQAKSRGASTEGALTLVSQLALESGYATNSGALKHKNPYSLMPGGKMATFSDYGSATTAFFNNLDKNWPTAMTALSGDVTADALDKAYHTGDYEKLGGAYMERDKVNNYDYGTKILGANSSISRRFIKALDQGIADNNAIISADSKLISSDLSQIQDLVSKGDLDGAAKVSQHLNKTAKESNAAQNKNDTYGRIKSDLQNNQ